MMPILESLLKIPVLKCFTHFIKSRNTKHLVIQRQLHLCIYECMLTKITCFICASACMHSYLIDFMKYINTYVRSYSLVYILTLKSLLNPF